MARGNVGSSPARLPKFQGVSPSNYVIEVRDYNLKRLLVKSSKRLGNREGGNGGFESSLTTKSRWVLFTFDA